VTSTRVDSDVSHFISAQQPYIRNTTVGLEGVFLKLQMVILKRALSTAPTNTPRTARKVKQSRTSYTETSINEHKYVKHL
jgi:hypothetical protein